MRWLKSVQLRKTMEKLNEDFLEFVRLLEQNDVRYLIVGGYAVGLHGFPRYTGDIDFFVAISEENSSKILTVFESFGFGELDINKSDFLTKDYVVEIGREPRKIQLLTGIDGVDFDACYPNRVEVTYADLVLKFIGKGDLLINKQASGRSKDLIDFDELNKIDD